MLLVFDTMDSIRVKLGKREYQIIFHADKKLDYELVNDNYIFLTAEVDAIAGMLEINSTNCSTLTDLSMPESTLEKIYVKLMSVG
jgi:hypothetical protein